MPNDVLLVAIPATIIIIAALWRHRGERITTPAFFVARRDVNPSIVALSIASAWIWTVALYVVPQKIYQLGIVAGVALVGVNAASILLLGALVPNVREFCGNRVLTLPQFAAERDGKLTEGVLTAGVLGVQIYSVITHLLGATLLIAFMTGGLPKPTLIVMLALCFLAVAATRGLQSSIVADIVKYLAVFGVALFILALTKSAGGLTALGGGVYGLRPPSAGLADAKTFWLFVVPVSMGLLSAVAMDDQLYQRGFSARVKPRRAYLLGALLFLPIVGGLGCLGLLAANTSLRIPIGTSDTDLQLVNFRVMQHLMPHAFPLYLIVGAFMTSIIGSGGAALHAAGNVGAKNVAQMLFPRLPDKRLVLVSRCTMLATLGLGTFAALYSVGLFELWIGWNMFRATLFFPILALILCKRETVRSVFWVIVAGLVITLGSFALYWQGGDPIATASSKAILWAWGATALMLLMRLTWMRFTKVKFA